MEHCRRRRNSGRKGEGKQEGFGGGGSLQRTKTCNQQESKFGSLLLYLDFSLGLLVKLLPRSPLFPPPPPVSFLILDLFMPPSEPRLGEASAVKIGWVTRKGKGEIRCTKEKRVGEEIGTGGAFFFLWQGFHYRDVDNFFLLLSSSRRGEGESTNKGKSNFAIARCFAWRRNVRSRAAVSASSTPRKVKLGPFGWQLRGGGRRRKEEEGGKVGGAGGADHPPNPTH